MMDAVFRRVFETTSAPIMLCEIGKGYEEAVITEANTAAAKLFGYKGLTGCVLNKIVPDWAHVYHRENESEYSEELGRNVGMMVCPFHAKSNIVGTARAVQGVRSDGTMIDLILAVDRLDDGPNGQRRYAGSFTDVTDLIEERKKAEAQAKEIELMNHLAAHDVMASTKGSRKSLQFVRRSLAQMAEQYPDNTRLPKQIAKVDRAIIALGTANELLEERSKMLNLNERLEQEKYLVHELAKDVAASTTRPGFRLNIDVPDDCYLLTDRSYIKRVFTNLIENSFNHNDKASPIVSFTICLVDDNFVIFKVIDNGIGLSQENIENIGKLPGKAGQFNKDSTGSGSGWFTTRRVLEAMSYQFDIQSVLKKGTTISVIAPVYCHA